MTRIASRSLPAAIAALAAGLTLYAYRELPGRAFAADDFQWLLNVGGLSPAEALARAFDTGSQSFFFRPLVWLLIWLQMYTYGPDPGPFHYISLGLHLLCAALLGLLVYRLQPPGGRQPRAALAALAFAALALHPAPFEAVVWISAQSELLAAALLLLAMHLWLAPHPAGPDNPRPAPVRDAARVLLATAALGMALLTKESAVIGLGLLLLLGPPLPPGRPAALRWGAFAIPLALTGAYLALQADILARNEIVRGAGYGLGPQLLLNPLRSLGLAAAPLPGTQYGDAWWLPWAGAALVGLWLVDLGFWIGRRRPGAACYLRLALGVALTLLPTAPFASPPDSRYTYLTVMAVAALATMRASWISAALAAAEAQSNSGNPRSRVVIVAGAALLALAWWGAGECAAREGRFAAATGPGGSMWRLLIAECGAQPPSRVVVVDPPLAPPHAEAIVRLACGRKMRPAVVGRDGLEDALRPGALVVAFPGGGAQVERRT